MNKWFALIGVEILVFFSIIGVAQADYCPTAQYGNNPILSCPDGWPNGCPITTGGNNVIWTGSYTNISSVIPNDFGIDYIYYLYPNNTWVSWNAYAPSNDYNSLNYFVTSECYYVHATSTFYLGNTTAPINVTSIDYPYRYPIMGLTSMSEYPLSVNSTGKVNNQDIYWALIRGLSSIYQPYVYSTIPFPLAGQIAIATQDNIQTKWAREDQSQRNQNPWDANYIFVENFNNVTANDSSQYSTPINKNNGTVISGGIFGNAMDYPGKFYKTVIAEGNGADYTDCFPGQNGLMTSYTIELWVNSTSVNVPGYVAGGVGIFSLWGEEGAAGIYENQICPDNELTIQHRLANNTNALICYRMSPNTWYYLVDVWNGTYHNFWVDGVLTNSTPAPSFRQYTLGCVIGGAEGEEGFRGQIDKVWVSKIARSNEYIQNQYQNGIGGFPTIGSFEPNIWSNATRNIAPITLSVTPTNGTTFTTYSFLTSSIYNGTSPYNMSIYAWDGGNKRILAYCDNLIENDVCSGSFKGTDILSSGNILLWGEVRDSSVNYAQTTAARINIIKASLGQPLILNYTASPLNSTSENQMDLSLRFTGGKSPFKIIFWDTSYNPICTFENVYTTYYILNMFPFAGSHYLGATVYSSDGQVAVSTPIISESEQGGNVFRLNNRVINCVNNNGIFGGGNEEYGVSTPTSTSQNPQKPTNIAGFTGGFISIITTPMVIWTVLLGIMSIMAEKYLKIGGKGMMIIFIVGITLLSIFGVYPTWVLIIEGGIILIVGAFYGRKMMTGN